MTFSPMLIDVNIHHDDARFYKKQHICAVLSHKHKLTRFSFYHGQNEALQL